MRSLFAVVLLAGCSTEASFNVKSLSCDEPILFDADITTHLANGPGTGAFDYDPQGRFEAHVAGGYDLGTGDFRYTTEYDPDAWLAKSEVDGYGYANRNGDLDVEYSITRTDVNGESWSIDQRIERVGCAQTVRYYYPDAGVEVVEEGSYQAGGYAYARTTPIDGEPDQVVEGVVAPELTYTQTLDWSGSDYDYAYTMTGDADGYSRTDWNQQTADYDFEGVTENFLDGTEKTSYTGEGQGTTFEQEYEIDYNGDGSGRYTEGDTECELTFRDFACTYDCGGNSQGDC
jgi:hypothetical protein